MNKKILVVGGLVLVVAAIVTATLLNREGAGSCESFIRDIQKNDSKDTYAKFSDHAKSLTSSSDWSKTVYNLYSFYGTVAPSRISHTENATTPKSIDERWEVTDSVNTYSITCSLVQSGRHYQVDTFTSQVKYD